MGIKAVFLSKVLGVVALLSTSSVMAATEYRHPFTYTYQLINDGTEAMIYKGELTAAITPQQAANLSVPTTLGGKPVTVIGRYAFYNCSLLYGVTIPATVTNISANAFSMCTGLQSVSFAAPSSLINIDTSAFYGCSRLASITLPNSVQTIRNNVFQSCTNLSSIILPPSVTVLEDTVFANTKLSSFTISTNITSMGQGLFRGCSNLTSVTFAQPSALKSIGQETFQYCYNLNEIVIPNSVTNIGIGAFQDCTELSAVTLPDTLTALPDYLFAGCSKLSAITIPSSVTKLGAYTFSGCIKLTSVSVPASVQTIGSRGFASCSSLTSLVFEDSSQLTTISSYGFASCTALSSLTLPPSVTTLGERAFSFCSALTALSIPASVTYLGDYLFSTCSSLMAVTFYGNRPATVPASTKPMYHNTPAALVTYVPVGSTGWGVTIPGTWMLKAIRYFVVVSFDAQGGVETPLSKNVGVTQSYGTLPSLTREGYVFGGWFTEVNGGGTEITSATTVTLTTPHTLYAKWTREEALMIIGGEAVTNAVSTNFMANVTQEAVDAAMAHLTNHNPEITVTEVGELRSIADAIGVSMELLATETNIVLFTPKVEISELQMPDIEETGSISLSFVVDNGITDTAEAMRLLEQSVSKRIQVVVMSSLFEAGTQIQPSFEFKDGKCTVVFIVESPLPAAFFRVNVGNTQ